MIALSAVSVFATVEDNIKAAKLELGAEFVPADINNAIEMRGFTASPDGKYVYGGFLQGGRYVVRFNTSDNSQAGSYKPESSDNELYCKGLAVDDRGYLYVGITHNGQGDITVAAVDKDMKEVGKLVEDLGSKTGINGVAVQKIGEKYYLYAVTAYNVDGVRRYDVTDPTKITLDTSFANNGVMDYSAVTGGTGDPSYIAVDTDGYIYLTYLKTGSGKGSHVGKISADGKSLVKEAEVTQAYGICEAGDYVFTATYNKADSCVKVLKKADLSEVATLKYAAQANNLSDVAFGGDTLFVGDHGNNAIGGAYYKAAIKLSEDTPDPVEPYAPGAIGKEAQKFTVSGAEVGFEMDGDVLVVNTTAGAADPWFSIALPQVDTTVYPSFTVKYRVSSMHANNVYLQDTEKNKGYSPESGTWTAPGLNADGQWQEKTYTIESAFPTMAGTILTGVRFPGATAGNKFELASITFNTADVKPDPSLGMMSFDAVVIDGVEHDMVNAETGQHLGNAGQWIKENPISFEEGKVKTISARGWAQAVDGTVDAFGYKIDDGELVSGAQYTQDRPDLAGFGIQNASGFNGFNVDVSALKAGDHKITIYMISGETEIKLFDVPFTVTAAVSVLTGDVNGDGSVNNKDVTALFQFVSEDLKEGETYVEANADVNGDGSINNKDVKALFDIISSH
jgi:hypothetical protein